MTREEWRIMEARDAAYDGQLYCGLISQRVVCKPSCAVRRRDAENIVVFHSLEEAQRQGYQPCSHCRPEKPDWMGAKAELVASAQRYIEQHSAEKFCLQTMAGALYVNGSYLLRTFRERTGSTLLAYHNYTRCENAKRFLARPELTVSQAGEMAGFTSSSHFSRIFKKVTGVTPSAYRHGCLREEAE